MKRICARPLRPLAPAACLSALALLAAVGCSGDDGDLPGATDAVMDAGGLPDARVLPRQDAGIPPTPPPTLSRVSPSSGPVGGGTRVTLRGSLFSEPVEVFFGTDSAASVVVLDEGTLAATTPPGERGAVSVRVMTNGGAAELPNAFTYVRELRLDRVSPLRVPEEGGVSVTLSGMGFTPETVVLFDRQPLRNTQVVSEEQITGYLPALEVGRPEVRVITNEGAVRRSDVVTVYGTPEVRAIAPGYGPPGGGGRHEIVGEGLSDAVAVLIGGTPARGLTVEGPGRLTISGPNLQPGTYDVVVESPDARGTLSNGFVVFDPSRQDLHILGVTPRRVPRGTPAVVSIVGGGFDPQAQVAIGDQRLVLRALSTQAIEVELPSTLPVGTSTLEVLSGTNRSEATIEIFAPLSVNTIQPAFGPATGGTEVTISGEGFRPDLEARLGDVPLVDVVVVDANTLTGRTVAGAHGPSDVVIRQKDGRARLRGAFSFLEPFQVVRVEPLEGSIAGNTYVSIIGRGFDAPVSARFGEAPGSNPRVENGSIMAVRSPPAAPGTVELSVQAGVSTERSVGSFTYFDPRLIAGGAWGGPIEGAVNVAVIDNEGMPMPGMTVQLGLEGDPRYRATTDINGVATVSSPEIRGAQTVTVGGTERAFTTFADINARNLTMFSSSHPQPPPEGQPPGLCPLGQTPPTIRGRIFELKSAIDPETSPGIVPVVRITYSEANVFSPNPPQPPEQFDFVMAEGEEYEIVTTRAGSVAVYAILGDFDQATQQFTPRRLGIVRSVPVAPNTATEGVDIALNIDMDQTIRIRLDDPPDQNPGPSLNAVFPFLNVESDGVIPFQASVVQGSGEVILRNMPALAESQFFYMGGSFSQGAQGGLGSPYSLTLLESGAPADEGVDLGPFLEMPTNVRPKTNELLVNGRLAWDQGGVAPDLVALRFTDSRAFESCCYFDVNMNGQFDEGVDQTQCSNFPIPFSRWSVFAPGGRQSYALPRMPPVAQAFETPRIYGYTLELALAPRFSWEEFSYVQFSQFFWQSWVVFNSQVTVKEETD